jgi:hypothetical protein
VISRAFAGLVCGIAALVFVAGCSNETPGNPVATGNGTTTTTPRSTSPGPSTGSQASGIKPCDLLSASDRTTLGLGEGDPDVPGRLPTCDWTASGKGGIQIGLSNNGLAALKGENVGIGKHKAIKSLETGGFGGCGVVIELTTTSSVIVLASVMGAKTQEEACPRAIEVAKIIDPKLP